MAVGNAERWRTLRKSGHPGVFSSRRKDAVCASTVPVAGVTAGARRYGYGSAHPLSVVFSTGHPTTEIPAPAMMQRSGLLSPSTELDERDIPPKPRSIPSESVSPADQNKTVG
ncbi:hypothetical protein O988_04657 [Pseudogymnoascus sp. VKM F-3808]|nr:hypothetical protein O988_04657 [Pseudogymnoascus sp. VKM F-3808]